MPVGFWPFLPVLMVSVWHWSNHRKFAAQLRRSMADLLEVESL